VLTAGQPAPGRLLVGVMLFVVAAIAVAGPGPEPPPNIIVILGDDVGVETIGAYGGESYRTPELDRLAADGIRFDHAHSQPLCTPSRVKLLTGQYNFRNHRHFGYLDPNQRTFAHLLKSAGYQTAVVGKWQLFNNELEGVQGARPADAGFDDFLVWQLESDRRGSRYWGPLLNHNGEYRQHPPEAFGPDLLNDYVLDIIERHETGPFLIFYSMALTHDPWVTTPDMRNESASDQDKFAAMLAYMDKLVGKVRRKVEESGIAERTVILFVGDNGTSQDIVSQFRGRTVRGGKRLTTNAATHVPFLAWGPGLVGPGAVSDSLVNLNDILPTLAQLAGVELNAANGFDGESLVPVMRGESELGRDSLFIHYESFRSWPEPARYVFDRRWKLYNDGRFFDLENDPEEQSPVEVKDLSEEASARYYALAGRLEHMPGQFHSTQRIDDSGSRSKFLAVILLVLGCGLLLRWRLTARQRKSGV
jgi:arylsulfatase A